ncbi:ubiquinone biosynthesis protein [Brevundimonas naejangsanensis]|uniref:Ubiquinone biosynthesis protein n=2 Tax=Brevundimonas naejangsanensis TaxID=588932 RepID=A0A494RC81_9CAUL|nr:ubiquinone biosynthesis protein [Brevundimonas naejangsanensis]
MRRLVADKDDTEQVFEIMNALSGRSVDWGYEKLLKTPSGGRQAYRRQELADRLQDGAWLAGLPAGSVGAAYLAFVEAEDVSAYGLAEESRKIPDSEIEAAHPRAWFARRLRDVHDVWHVLTGYRADALGEACVVAFSLPQTRSAGFGLIAAVIAIQFARARTGHPCARAVFRAWGDGRRAAWLPGEDYEALLAEPLDEARRRLRIPRPTLYERVPTSLCNAYRGGRA